MIETFLNGLSQKCIWPIWSQESKLTVSHEWMEQTDFLPADTYLEKLKVT